MFTFLDLVSDLHAELGAPAVKWPSDAATRDILLAGDIGRVCDGSWLAQIKLVTAEYRHVYIVLGNHEFYNCSRKTVEEVEAIAREQISTVPNATLLQRSAATTKDNVKILGATLWSDARGQAAAVEASLSDYRRVWVAGDNGYGGTRRRATVADTSAMWERDVAWLQRALKDEPSPVVVLTHHGPALACNPPQFADNPLSSAFVSEVALPSDKVTLAVSGHTHGRVQAVSATGVPCVSHCLGYPGEIDGAYSPLRLRFVDGAFDGVEPSSPTAGVDEATACAIKDAAADATKDAAADAIEDADDVVFV